MNLSDLSNKRPSKCLWYHTVHNYVLITQAKEEFSWVLIVLHLLDFLYRNNGSVAFVFVAKLIVFEIHMVNGLVLLNT